MRTKLSSVVLLGLVVGAVSAQAQWVSQNFALQAGWNAIYLHVQPEPRALDVAFTNLPVDMVYKWQRPEAAIQFDVDPGNPFPRPGDWQTWYPPVSDRQFLSSFGDLLANQAYYIHVTNVSGCALNLKGTPVLNSYTWPGNAYSLYGLPVPSSAAPTFTDFFSATATRIKIPLLSFRSPIPHLRNRARLYSSIASPSREGIVTTAICARVREFISVLSRLIRLSVSRDKTSP